MKKIRQLFFLAAAAAIVLLFQRFAPPPPPPAPDVDPRAMTLEQSPPSVENIWVQRILTPLPTGENMIMRFKLNKTVAYDTIPDTVAIYYGSGSGDRVIFRDNGFNPDPVPGDGIYSAFITEDIPAFRSNMIAAENAMTLQGHYLKFVGHSGKDITTIPHFDVTSFDAFNETNLSIDLTRYPLHMDCRSATAKEKSLLITDLSVVEDPSRTYNPIPATPTGNPYGCWTFGEMMRKACGPGATANEAARLMKSWIKHWTETFVMNDQTVAERGNVYKKLLEGWIRKSTPWDPYVTIYKDNWSEAWDNADDTLLMINAPFKLTAIANRIDLRGSSAYSSGLNNSGETRFIYTLEEADDAAPAGRPPMSQHTHSIVHDGDIDWVGLNIILEYQNPPGNRCDLRTWAGRWRDLSNHQFSTALDQAYNLALQGLTDEVTAINAKPGRPNGSALLRMRTNEKILRYTDGKEVTWLAPRWQFRQFEISAATGLFEQVLLPNVPADAVNGTTDDYVKSNPISLFPFIVPFPTYPQNMTNWIYTDSPFILNGNHNMPKTAAYPGYPGPTAALQAPIAEAAYGYVHYFEMNVTNSVPQRPVAPEGSPLSDRENELRHQVSLNTCQGCHNGETKTFFTHIAPLRAGEPARYWISPMDYRYSILNASPKNQNFVTSLTITNPGVSEDYFVNVSAFLTGRTLHKSGSGTHNNDDRDDPSENSTDHTMEGLFYVHNPGNVYNFYYGSSSPPHINPYGNGRIMYGYNDLERRFLDLCLFIHTPCSLSATSLARNITFTPLPFAAH